ncbi:MAG: NUDIX domain-containing protein [Anaerolineae bacterium]|nr:NUDIX domain-containing protein [Anaerolineae bacterium]
MRTKTLNKPEWPPTMAVCVGMVVLDGNRILFVRQAAGQSLAGQWSIPWGMVDAGETPEAAALRETREEAGINAQVEGLLGIQNLQRPGWMGIVFLVRHVSGNPQPDNVETDRAAYITLEEIEQAEEPFEPWCRWLACRVLKGVFTIIPSSPGNPYAPRMGYL